jgi:hypothetical protein
MSGRPHVTSCAHSLQPCTDTWDGSGGCNAATSHTTSTAAASLYGWGSVCWSPPAKPPSRSTPLPWWVLSILAFATRGHGRYEPYYSYVYGHVSLVTNSRDMETRSSTLAGRLHWGLWPTPSQQNRKGAMSSHPNIPATSNCREQSTRSVPVSSGWKQSCAKRWRAWLRTNGEYGTPCTTLKKLKLLSKSAVDTRKTSQTYSRVGHRPQRMSDQF